MHHGQHAAHMQQPSVGQDAYSAQHQQRPKHQAVKPTNTNQIVSYHVEEPDSPLQSANAASLSGHHSQGADASLEQRPRQPHKPIFAGCMLSETTFKRTTTPSRHGKAWSNVEEVTVRQIREIRQAEAATLMKEPQRSNSSCQRIPQRHQDAMQPASLFDNRPEYNFGSNRQNRPFADWRSEPIAAADTSDTFAAYNFGSSSGPPSQQGSLPAVKERGKGRARMGAVRTSRSRQQFPRPRMKRLFSDDEEIPLNSADAERLRRQQEHDKEDAIDRALDVRF